MRYYEIYLLFTVGLSCLVPLNAYSKNIKVNDSTFINSPTWLTTGRVNADIEKVQSFMEWDLRNLTVRFYDKNSTEAFKKVHGFGDSVMAVSIKTTMTIHIGPKVDEKNFDEYFEHELVHIILFQKYKTAVPDWLNEGLANYVSKHGKVDYSFVNKQIKERKFSDFKSLTHPYVNQDGEFWLFHYQTSTALVEMIASKCNLNDLLQLSVGKKLETYISNTCGIADINAAFLNWVNTKAK